MGARAGKAATKQGAAKRAERNAIRLLTVLASIPESERLDALATTLDVWAKCPTLRSADCGSEACRDSSAGDS